MVQEHERIRKLEDGMLEQKGQLLSLAANVTDLHKELADAEKRLTDIVQPLAFAIMGDPSKDGPGLRDRVRTLEKSEQNRKWLLGIVFTTVLGLVAKAVYDWVGSVNRSQRGQSVPADVRDQ